MSTSIKDKAQKYYPTYWDKIRLDKLLSVGALTQEEYDEVIKEEESE